MEDLQDELREAGDPPAWADHLWVLQADPFGATARELVARLSADLGGRYGDDGTGLFDPGDAEVFLIAWWRGVAVGCGALCRRGPDLAEIKRMYVDPAVRRRGLARKLLARLELLAGRRGCARVILETGTRQPEALALYETAGYARCEPYGPYLGNPFSVCFEKSLSPA